MVALNNSLEAYERLKCFPVTISSKPLSHQKAKVTMQKHHIQWGNSFARSNLHKENEIKVTEHHVFVLFYNSGWILAEKLKKVNGVFVEAEYFCEFRKNSKRTVLNSELSVLHWLSENERVSSSHDWKLQRWWNWPSVGLCGSFKKPYSNPCCSLIQLFTITETICTLNSFDFYLA